MVDKIDEIYNCPIEIYLAEHGFVLYNKKKRSVKQHEN